MTCQEAREALLDYERGQLEAGARALVASHLEGCASCQTAAAAEAGLSNLLAQKLPRYAAPEALKRKLGERAMPQSPARRPVSRHGRLWAPVVSALSAAALVLVGVRVLQPELLRPRVGAADVVSEGVNDHLRVVSSTHPVEIESGGIHQVKPWFAGRLDFAPQIAFEGDDQVHLEGGSIGYFRDRKAAIYVFKLRLHTATLLVFRAEGLPWRERNLHRIGSVAVDAQVERGFNVLLWRKGELGYCLVSDTNRGDLEALAAKVAGPAE